MEKLKDFFSKTQGILRKTQSFANSEVEIIVKKRPKKDCKVSFSQLEYSRVLKKDTAGNSAPIFE